MSGDLGYKDDDGYFHFSGRKKRVIIISGYNVYPSDIEKKTQELDFVKEACCVKGYKDSKQIIRMFVSFSKNGNEEEYKEAQHINFLGLFGMGTECLCSSENGG